MARGCTYDTPDNIPQTSDKVNNRAVIYARYSSGNQREASIEDQIRVCAEYIDRSSLILTGTYHDSAISGLTDARPEFQRMIKDGESHLFDVLVVYSLDRFARDKYDSAVYKTRLKRAGIRIIYVSTPVGEGAEAVLMEALLEGMAQYYSENLSRNVKRGIHGNALKGIHTGSRIPLGYKLNAERKLEINPVTSPTVRRIYEMYADGCGRAEIIRALNRDGCLTGDGKPFAKNSIINILTNETYKGVFHYADVRIEDAVPPIISKDLYDKVQHMIEINSRAKARAKAKDDYILTGKVFCGHCGAWLIGESGRSKTGATYNYYTCGSRKRGRGCPKHPERKADLETLAVRLCLSALTDDLIASVSVSAADSLRREAEKLDRAPALRRELHDTETKIENILRAIEDGIYTPSTRDRLAALEADRARLTADLVKAERPRPTLTADMIAYWLTRFKTGDPADPDFTSTLINTLLNSITIYDEGENKKIVAAFNLDSHQRTLTGSDIAHIVQLNHQYPNYTIYKHTCAFIFILTSLS